MKISAAEGDVIEIEVGGTTISIAVGPAARLSIPRLDNPRKTGVVTSIEEPAALERTLAEGSPDETHTSYQPPGRPLMALSAGGAYPLPPIGTKFTRCNSVTCNSSEKPILVLTGKRCKTCKTPFEYDYIVTAPVVGG